MANKSKKNNDDIQITNNFSFASKIGKSHIVKYKESLNHYFNNFNSAVNLENDIPIFLDTNVLLRTYSISFKAREKLKEFFKENSERIYIVGQVQKEFTKNRETAIDEFSLKVDKKLPEDFKNTVINQLQAFLESNSVVLKDYNFLENKLKKIKKDCDNLYKKLEKEIETHRIANKNIKYVDELLDIYTQFNLLDGLTDNEIDLLKNEFDEFKKAVKDISKIDSIINKPYGSFPGIGDIKMKPENPYGDYIIFHEILKYVKHNSIDVVFLTYDIKKGDWLRKGKQPHLHYIENVYLNTNKSIYILNAERTFEDLLDISFESVYGEGEILDYDSEQFIGSFLFLWAQLERILRETSKRFDLAVKRPLEIVRELYRLEVIDKDFINEFDELRVLRNEVVHGFYNLNSLSAEDKEFMQSRLVDLINIIGNLPPNLPKRVVITP